MRNHSARCVLKAVQRIAAHRSAAQFSAVEARIGALKHTFASMRRKVQLRDPGPLDRGACCMLHAVWKVHRAIRKELRIAPTVMPDVMIERFFRLIDVDRSGAVEWRCELRVLHPVCRVLHLVRCRLHDVR